MLAPIQEDDVLKPMCVLLTLLLSAAPQEPPAAPAAPADAAAKSVVNPVKPTAESQAFAKKMYGYDCAVCHGEKGDGKGELAAEQKPPLKDWTDAAALKDLSDGEMFNVIKTGKGTMPGEGERLKPDQVWNMVILVRSYSKK
jgi:mono/diheme cytochrome c family protein